MNAFFVILLLFTEHIFTIHVFALDRAINVLSPSELHHGSSVVGKYTAIIIGIDEYQDINIPDLQTAVNDSIAISDVLIRKYNFRDIILLHNKDATREGIDTIFRNKIVTMIQIHIRTNENSMIVKRPVRQ